MIKIWNPFRPRIIADENMYVVKLGLGSVGKYLDIDNYRQPYYWTTLNRHVTRFESIGEARRAFNKVRGYKEERFVEYL